MTPVSILICSLTAYAFFVSPLFAQPVVRIHADPMMHQTSIRTAALLVDPDFILATSDTRSIGLSYVNCGIYMTADAGMYWTGTDSAALPPSSRLSNATPVASPNGIIFLVGTPGGGGSGISSSTNRGETWSSLRLISTGSLDEVHASVNDVAGSPYYGNLVAGWSDLSLATPAIRVTRSTDNGVTWDLPSPVQLPANGHYQQGLEFAIGASGEIYACWGNPRLNAPYTNEFVGFARSTNGGVQWSGNTNMYACNGIRGTLTEKGGIRVDDFPRIAIDRSGGVRNGWMYSVTAEKDLAPAGSDPDVILHRSTDGGETWSLPIRVNQDSSNNGKMQYAPSIAVDAAGGINVIYHDDRMTSIDSAGIVLSRSIDGGNTWRDSVVSDHRFKPSSLPGLAYTERTALLAVGSSLLAFWIDDITGTKQIWMARIEATTGSAQPIHTLPLRADLQQNFPNPFNPVTQFRYSIPARARVVLRIHTMLGQEVATLVDAEQMAATYSPIWDASGSAAGVYIARLTVVDGASGAISVSARKVVLLK
jgi:hypothetical protein